MVLPVLLLGEEDIPRYRSDQGSRPVDCCYAAHCDLACGAAGEAFFLIRRLWGQRGVYSCPCVGGGKVGGGGHATRTLGGGVF